MGIEVIEKVKKHYVMERMTSGLIRCLRKSAVWPWWSSGRQKAKKKDVVLNIRPL